MSVRILVPMDGSPLSKRALEHALSTHPDADVTVLYVVDYIEESYGARALIGSDELRERAHEHARSLFEDARALADEYDATIETDTAEGDPSREICAYAADHDVDQIVVGSHGRSPMSRILLGSVAESVTRRAPVPVTVVR